MTAQNTKNTKTQSEEIFANKEKEKRKESSQKMPPNKLAAKNVLKNDSFRRGILKGKSITVLLTSCFTDLESAVWQLTIFVFIFKTD